jgi:hypothetical protein
MTNVGAEFYHPLMTAATKELADFNGDAFIDALDRERQAQGLTWTKLADELWMQSADLNARLGGDALCPGALYRTSLRKTMTCQYALPLLRWLGRPPEEFLGGTSPKLSETALPDVGPDKRLRWNLGELYAALDERRRELGLTWTSLAGIIGCTPSRLTNLRTAKLADMGLAMQLTQWLGQPAARFIHATDW